MTQLLNNMSGFESLFVSIVIFAIVFLVLREFFTWYWKINKAISLLEQIERNTRKEGSKENPTIQRIGAFTDGPVER